MSCAETAKRAVFLGERLADALVSLSKKRGEELDRGLFSRRVGDRPDDVPGSKTGHSSALPYAAFLSWSRIQSATRTSVVLIFGRSCTRKLEVVFHWSPAL